MSVISHNRMFCQAELVSASHLDSETSSEGQGLYYIMTINKLFTTFAKCKPKRKIYGV